MLPLATATPEKNPGESPVARELANSTGVRPIASSVDFVVNRIKELLLDGKLLPGDRLPTETELTRLLAVSRGSVREAMKSLSALGIVEIRRGDGTYVSQRDVEPVFDPLLFSLIVSRPKFDELKELRLILEQSVVRLVARNADEDDLEVLRASQRRLHAAMRENRLDGETLLALELEFHGLLGQFTKNGPLCTVYRFVMQYFKPYIAESLLRNTQGRESAAAHEAILAAIERRDAAAAERAVAESLEIWEHLVAKS